MNLTEEQILIRDMAKRFAAEKLLPGAAERDRTSAFPKDAFNALGELGLLGMMTPAEWDGAEAGHVAYALALEEIAAADASLSTIVSVHNGVGQLPILGFGNDQQKQKYLKPLARGDMLGAFALTEPNAGSDASDLKCQAKFNGNHYILSGTKQFITSGREADVVIVFAITNPEGGKKGISAFIVPTNLAGYRVSGIEKKMGQRASDTAQITFDNVELSPDLLLGNEGDGYKIALSNLEGGRIGIAAQSVGMARAAYEIALNYANERKTFGKLIIEHQAVAFRLADMATQIEAARLLVMNAATLRDLGEPCLKHASMAKLFASEMAEKVCSDAIQTLGGYGYVEDFPLERIYRDVRVCQIYEGTSDIQRMVIARAISKGV